MTKRIYLVGGSKGGVGKSMVTMGLVDFLHGLGEKVLLVDSDTSNPDVSKAFKTEVKCELVNLDEADGWIELVNQCAEHRDSVVVINTAARNNRGVAAYGTTLRSTLGEMDRELVTLWVINRQRDSLELLSSYLETMADTTVHVVRNGYFGEARKFELFNGSKLRETVEGKGGKSLFFPDLADRVSDDLYSRRLSIQAAASVLPIGNRAELQRWRAELQKMLSEVIH